MIQRNIPVNEIIKYKRFTERRKNNYVNKLNTPPPEKIPGKIEPHYWASAISAIKGAYKFNDNSIIDQKIEKRLQKMEEFDTRQGKSGCQANINILRKFEGFDFSQWRPKSETNDLPVPRKAFLIKINDLLIKIKPHLIFSFDDNKKIGSLFIVMWKHGYDNIDLGILSEVLYLAIKENYSKDYTVSSEYCLIIDAGAVEKVSYSQVERKEIPSVLDSVIDDIKFHDK